MIDSKYFRREHFDLYPRKRMYLEYLETLLRRPDVAQMRYSM